MDSSAFALKSKPRYNFRPRTPKAKDKTNPEILRDHDDSSQNIVLSANEQDRFQSDSSKEYLRIEPNMDSTCPISPINTDIEEFQLTGPIDDTHQEDELNDGMCAERLDILFSRQSTDFMRVYNFDMVLPIESTPKKL